MQVRLRPADHLRALLAEPSRKEIGKSPGHVGSGFVAARELATPADIACCDMAGRVVGRHRIDGQLAAGRLVVQADVVWRRREVTALY